MMKRLTHRFLVFAAVFALSNALIATAAEQSGTRQEAIVTALDGTAQVFTKGRPGGRALRKSDRLGSEHEIRVGERSRIEIRFPDGTVMRLSEKTRLAMSELKYDSKTESKNVQVSLAVGKLWANVRKLMTPDSSVEVKTSNAVAGVRGTVYRMNVEEDQSALVKVYDGSVSVASPPKDDANRQQVPYTAPVPVPGPHEVPPPMHEVTLEEWHVIVKAMQQVAISSQGVASEPQEFDPKVDADDWVKWNQERDRQMKF